MSSQSDRAERAAILGDAYLGLGQNTDAVEWYQQGKALSSGNDRDLAYDCCIGLGEAEQRLRHWPSAEQNLLRALDFASTNSERDRALSSLAAVASASGDTAKAATYRSRLSTAPPPVRESPRPVAANTPKRDPSAPKIIDREEWDPKPMRRGKDPAVPMGKPNRITIHHGGEAQKTPPTNYSESVKRLQGYQNAHMEGQHWADIGYHFVIDGSGRIWEGREIRWQGAHAGSPEANAHNIGICIMGNFEQYEPSAAAKSSLKELVAYLMRTYQIPLGSVDGHEAVKKKNDLSGTKCPGRHLKRYVDQLKRDLAARK